MATTPPTRIEADVKYRKILGIFGRWSVGPRNASSNPYFKGDKIHLKAGSGQHQIVFFVSSGRHDLQWADDPIWVQEGSCPKSPASHPDIHSPVVDPVTRALAVTDDVSTPGELHYSLNFTKKNGRPKNYDPIIIHE